MTRVKSVEAGVSDLDVLGTTEPKGDPLGLGFTDLGSPIGAVRLHYISQASAVRVTGIVDPACVTVSDVRNIDRGGDPSVLQNFDTLAFSLGGTSYALRVGVGETFTVRFGRFQQ